MLDDNEVLKAEYAKLEDLVRRLRHDLDTMTTSLHKHYERESGVTKR